MDEPQSGSMSDQGHMTNHGRVITNPKVPVDSDLEHLHVCSSLMASDPSDIWSPRQGTTTFTDTFSPTRQSYSSQSGIFFLLNSYTFDL